MSVEQVLDTIANMTVMEVTELVKAMEEKFGVSAAAAVAVAAAGPAAGGDAAASAEQTEFDVVMSSFGDKKINVIKTVRAITGLGLKEAKEKVEGVPCALVEGVDKAKAEEVKAQLEEAGATVDIK